MTQSDSDLIRIENWDRRQHLCKRWGFRYALVFLQQHQRPACMHRIRIKQFAAQRWGKPVTLIPDNHWIHTDGAWLAAVTKPGEEYTIAFREKRYRDWALYL